MRLITEISDFEYILQNGFLYENGKQVRPLTEEEKNQLAQFKQEFLAQQQKFSNNVGVIWSSVYKWCII